MAKPTNTTPQLDLHQELHNFHVDVKMFGAVGTGAVDDTAAFQAALTAASGLDLGMSLGTKTVFVPPGTGSTPGYLITSTLTIPHGVTLQGAPGGSVLFHSAGSNPLLKIDTGDCTVRDLTLWKAPGGTGTGIYLVGVAGSGISRNVIDHVRFNTLGGDATHWAIETYWALETYISRCSISTSQGGGIYLGDTSNGSVIRDCTLSNAGAGAIGGINVQANGCLIEGNVIEAWRGSYGVKITGQHTSFIRNWLEDIYGPAIDMSTTGSSDINIIGNNVSVDTNSPYPLDINQGKDVLVAQNHMTFGSNGVRVRSGASSNEEAIVTFIANQFLGGASGGTIDVSGLSNNNDSVIRIGERRDALASFGNQGSAFEIVKGNARLGPGTIFGWKAGTNTEMDAYLWRLAANQISAEGTFIAPDGVATKTKAGTPSDADFTTTPPNGTIVVDTSANKIWVRTGAATWKGVVVA